MAENTVNPLEILGLNEQATPSEIQKRYQELYDDYNIRLTNAPTPALKKLYQKNLQEIEDAYSKLNIGKPSHADNSSLPSSRPTSNVSHQEFNKNEVTAGKNLKQEQAQSNQKNNKAKPPATKGISLTIFVSVTAVLIALTTLAVMLYFQGKTEVQEMVKVQNENADLLKHRDFLKNGKMKIENQLNKEIAIAALRVTYLDEKNELVRFVGNDVVYIEPGKSVNFDQYKEGKLVWDGSVLSYGLIVYSIDPISKVPLNPIQAYSGIWLHEWKENKLVITQ